MPSLEATLSRPETLPEHLLWQVRLSNFSESTRRSPSTWSATSRRPATCSDGSTVPQVARKLGLLVLRSSR
jgi:RNA polymerase sigma-54 factor